MRVFNLNFITAMIAAACQTLAAQTLHPVNTRAGYGIGADKIQVVVNSTKVDVPPKFISGAAPIYPISRLRRQESGYADIAFTVDETGHTRDFRVLSTSYLYFANHAILAVQNWRFHPATKNGRPVPCRIRIPFRYRIPGIPPATPSPSAVPRHP
jgi:TonB family protein